MTLVSPCEECDLVFSSDLYSAHSLCLAEMGGGRRFVTSNDFEAVDLVKTYKRIKCKLCLSFLGPFKGIPFKIPVAIFYFWPK